MDKSSSILAALNAGKLPSHEQIAQGIDALLAAPVLNNDPATGSGELSAQGAEIQNGIRNLLTAYKKLGENKNGAYRSPSNPLSRTNGTFGSRQHHPRIPVASVRG